MSAPLTLDRHAGARENYEVREPKVPEGCSPLVDADWYAFCHVLYKGIEGEDWEKCMSLTKK